MRSVNEANDDLHILDGWQERLHEPGATLPRHLPDEGANRTPVLMLALCCVIAGALAAMIAVRELLP
jgi:hypothetical protein